MAKDPRKPELPPETIRVMERVLKTPPKPKQAKTPKKKLTKKDKPSHGR